MAAPVPPSGFQIVEPQATIPAPPPGFTIDPKSVPASQSWGDVAVNAVQNIPSSAYNLGASIAHAVAHPIQTAEGIYDVGKGAVSKAAGAVGISQNPETKAANEASLNHVIDFFKDRYGSMDDFKKTLANDPVGVAMDLSTVLTGGETALARLPGVVGKAGEVLGDAARATNPINIATKAATKVAEPVVSNVLGMTTGAGATPIRQAARAGQEGSTVFTDNMRGSAPISDTVDMAQNALGKMRQERSAAYRADMANVTSNPPWGRILSYKPINDAVKAADGMVYYNGLAKSADAADTLSKIKAKIAEWGGSWDAANGPKGGPEWVAWARKTRSVEAMDALKQAIGEIRQKTQPGTLERRVADSIYNASKSSIVEQAPDYARAMKGYSDASEKIGELQSTFSLGEKASQDTALRKLQSVMRNNVNTNYGQRGKMMNALAAYEPDLPNALAGQALNSATPRGLAGLGAITLGGAGVTHNLPALVDPYTLAMMPAFSPRIVGEAAYAAGRGAAIAGPYANAFAPVAKAGYGVNALSGGMGPRYDQNGNLIPGQ